MKLFLLIILLLLCFHNSKAQKLPIKMGEIPIEDMEMKVYEPDSSASAVILADYGESSLIYNQQKGFRLNHIRITRIKILKKEGLDWADFTVQLYKKGSDRENISGLKGVTYNLENGKIAQTKMKNDAVFEEHYDENFDLIKFVLPNARVGSVIEVSYTLLSDFIFHFQDWSFQNTIPIRWSEYRTRIPEYFKYEKYMQGYLTPFINEESQKLNYIVQTSIERGGGGFRSLSGSQIQNDRIEFQEYSSRWVVKDVPAFKNEPNITTYKDYISKINFELSYVKFPNQSIQNFMGNWEDINRTFWESDNFGDVIRGNIHLNDDVSRLTNDATTDLEKIERIYQFVRNNINWDGTTRKYSDNSLRKVMDEKKGSSADINLLLASMLSKAKIDVSPVLVSTRDHGFVRESIPVSSQFNHVICLVKVEDRSILLDATSRYLPSGFLPERCLNGKGLVISKSGYSWVKLEAPIRSRSLVSTELKMNDEGTFTGKLVVDRSGYFAERDRKKYKSKDKIEYVKEFIGSNSWEITESRFENSEELSANFKEVHSLDISDHASVAGELIYFNPFFMGRIHENPYKTEKREYPVDFGSPFELSTYCKIELPKNYIVEELPSPKAMALPDNNARFLFNVIQNGNYLIVTSSVQINKPLFSQIEYSGLREFYAQIVAKEGEQIVLKKNSK